MTERIRPFSNGTQYINWEECNCTKCEKVNECDLNLALAAACLGDGYISEDCAKQIGMLFDENGKPFTLYAWPCASHQPPFKNMNQWIAAVQEKHKKTADNLQIPPANIEVQKGWHMLEKNKRAVSAEYLKYIRRHKCFIDNCQTFPIEAHHFGSHGIARKADDFMTVPLCYVHHRVFHAKGFKHLLNKFNEEAKQLFLRYVEMMELGGELSQKRTDFIEAGKRFFNAAN